MLSEVEQIKAQLDDAHLVVGEQTVGIRRLQMIIEQQNQVIEQLRSQLAEQNGDLGGADEREPVPIPRDPET